jgi:hypothetical protein
MRFAPGDEPPQLGPARAQRVRRTDRPLAQEQRDRLGIIANAERIRCTRNGREAPGARQPGDKRLGQGHQCRRLPFRLTGNGGLADLGARNYTTLSNGGGRADF